MGWVRYMFWSMVISGALMIIMSFMPSRQKQLLSALQDLKKQIGSASGKSSGPELASEANRQVSKSNTEKLIDDESYVLIEGRYYKARADNTYIVNGEKIFFVNNRRLENEEGASHKLAQKGRDTASQGDSSAGDSSDSAGELPTTPGQVLETFKKINSSMKERDKYLEQLEKGQ
jgi:hypothetical protein